MRERECEHGDLGIHATGGFESLINFQFALIVDARSAVMTAPDRFTALEAGQGELIGVHIAHYRDFRAIAGRSMTAIVKPEIQFRQGLPDRISGSFPPTGAVFAVLGGERFTQVT